MKLFNLALSVVAGAVGAWLVLNNYSPATVTNTVTERLVQDGATSHEERIVNTVADVTPAVVSIVITQDVPIVERYYDEFGGGSIFNPFTFRVPRLRQRGTTEREVGGGSGFLVSDDGMIITNRHVVEQDDASYAVFTSGGDKYDAEVLARDSVNDIAVLKINGQNLPYLEFSDSDELRVGQTAIAIGTPLGEFRNSVSTGIVSGLSRSIQASNGFSAPEQLDEVIQTDAAINPGNSGGPLLNLDGEVIGVNVAVALGSENIGFALPSNTVKDILESVQETGNISRPYLGVRYVPITPALQEKNNLGVDYGVLVLRGEDITDLAVIPNSPAAKAGLAEGDIILEANSERITLENDLAKMIRELTVGDVMALKVLANGKERNVNVTLEEIPE